MISRVRAAFGSVRKGGRARWKGVVLDLMHGRSRMTIGAGKGRGVTVH